MALSRGLALGTATSRHRLHVAYLSVWIAVGFASPPGTTSAGGGWRWPATPPTPTLAARTTPLPLAGGKAWRLVERNLVVYRRIWP